MTSARQKLGCLRPARRKFEGRQYEIEPYHKSLKKACFDFSTDHPNVEEINLISRIRFYWLLKCQLLKTVLLYPGFYSQYSYDAMPQQKICYMDPISSPPTRNDVVRETMKRSMKVALESKQEYGIFIYDLAVALKAYSIQALDSPDFDKLLILLGNFHLELAFYGAVGTFIMDSSVQHLLTESGILAEGSLMGFLKGKYYNRCVRVHQILSLAMEIKIYQCFFSTLAEDRKEDIKDILQSVPESTDDLEEFLTSNSVFNSYMKQYQLFFEGVLKGSHGSTTQYWSTYVYMINN